MVRITVSAGHRPGPLALAAVAIGSLALALLVPAGPARADILPGAARGSVVWKSGQLTYNCNNNAPTQVTYTESYNANAATTSFPVDVIGTVNTLSNGQLTPIAISSINPQPTISAGHQASVQLTIPLQNAPANSVIDFWVEDPSTHYHYAESVLPVSCGTFSSLAFATASVSAVGCSGQVSVRLDATKASSGLTWDVDGYNPAHLGSGLISGPAAATGSTGTKTVTGVAVGGVLDLRVNGTNASGSTGGEEDQGYFPLVRGCDNQRDAGQTLPSKASLYTDNGYLFAMQGDGNLVLYHSGRATWSSRTFVAGSFLAVQTDGNMVIYSPAGRAVWSTRTPGTGAGHHLLVQDDGNVVLYNASWRAVWSTNTAGR